jgi:hypothetical protein
MNRESIHLYKKNRMSVSFNRTFFFCVPVRSSNGARSVARDPPEGLDSREQGFALFVFYTGGEPDLGTD